MMQNEAIAGGGVKEERGEGKRETRLHKATLQGNISVMAECLARGTTIHDLDQDKHSPLYRAAEHGQLEALRFLLDQGAPIEGNPEEHSPLSIAAANGHRSIVKWLWQQSADASAHLDDGLTLCFRCAQHGWLEEVSYLLDDGFSLDNQSMDGCSLLHVAAQQGHPEVVSLLLDRGAKIEAKDVNGSTALHWAAVNGHLKTVVLLLDRGADLLAENKEGQIAFDLAFREGHVAVSALLILPKLMGVWRGKKTPPSQSPTIYEPIAQKSEGCRPTFVVRSWSGTLYVARLGLSDGQGNLLETLARTKELYRLMGVNAIKEKIAVDVLALLGDGFFYVAEHRLATLPIENEYNRDHFLIETIMQLLNRGRASSVTECTHLLSKWVEKYRPLAELMDCSLERDAVERQSCLDYLNQGLVPQWVCVEGEVVPLLGMMEVLAVSRLTANTDVLGGRGHNAGFVVERSEDNKPIGVRVLKIDASGSFNFIGSTNQLIHSYNERFYGLKLLDKKDLQWGNNQSIVIRWVQLSLQQKDAFLATIRRGLRLLRRPGLLRLLIHRKGFFDGIQENGKKLLTNTIVATLIRNWQHYLSLQESPEVYGDLLAIEAGHLEHPEVPFRPKKFGVAHYKKEVDRLLASELDGGGGGGK